MAADIPEGGFRDPKLLMLWLDSLPHSNRYTIIKIIAHRAAMRALPFVAGGFGLKNNPLYSPVDVAAGVFRAGLISLICCKFDAEDVSNAAGSASNFLASARSEIPSARSAAKAAALACEASAFKQTAVTPRSGASDAAASAADAADAAAYAVQAAEGIVDPNSYLDVWNSITKDARSLAALSDPKSLIETPIWPDGEPAWWHSEWKKLQEALSERPTGSRENRSQYRWRVWLDWYEARSKGNTPWELSDRMATEIEERFALGDRRHDFWERLPQDINKEITRWVAVARAEIPESNSVSADSANDIVLEVDEILQIPSPKPASLRPKWENEVLDADIDPVPTHNNTSMVGQLAAFKAELQDFCDDIRGDNSGLIQYGVKVKIDRLLHMIPDQDPDIETLIRLTLREAFLYEYMPTVNAVWPDEHAADYRVITLRFTEMLDLFPDREGFIRSANGTQISAQNGLTIAEDARAFANQLREATAREFVSSSVTEALEHIALELERDINAKGGEVGLSPSQHMASYDVIQSIDNTLAQIAKKGEEWRPVAEGHASYQDSFSKEYVQASRQAGIADAQFAARWANKLLLANTAIQGLGFKLAKKYPKIFGWFERYVANRSPDSS